MEERTTFAKAAATWGVPFGIYLSCMSVAWIYTDRMPMLSIVATTMLLLIPFIIYRLMRRFHENEFGFTTFSSLWMLGILLFIYASLITALVTYCVFNFLRPDFFYEQAQAMVDMYRSNTDVQTQETVAIMQRIIDGNLMPRVIEMVFFAFWTVSFLGSLLSACIAWIVRLTPHKQQSPKHNF